LIPINLLNLLNLRRPMMAPLVGCIFPVELSGRLELKTVREYATENSLADVLSSSPEWWTPTVKSKAVVGIANGLGLLYGVVKASNILFDADRGIQIADFSPNAWKRAKSNRFQGNDGCRLRTLPRLRPFFAVRASPGSPFALSRLDCDSRTPRRI
jgi:hypothetical protein